MPISEQNPNGASHQKYHSEKIVCYQKYYLHLWEYNKQPILMATEAEESVYYHTVYITDQVPEKAAKRFDAEINFYRQNRRVKSEHFSQQHSNLLQ